MKVSFFSVTLLAALAIFETSQAVPIHTMSTSNTDAGLEVTLASMSDSGEGGDPVKLTLGKGETKTIDLTSTYTPKSGTGSSSAPVTQSCSTCKAPSGNQMESQLNNLVKDTNNLTKALMDKMTKEISKPDEKGCTLQDRLDNGFTLALENFEVGGLVPECKPATASESKKEGNSDGGCKSSTATITITPGDSCEEKKPAVTSPEAKPLTDTSKTAAKTTTTIDQKNADKTDAIKKLEASKPKA